MTNGLTDSQLERMFGLSQMCMAICSGNLPLPPLMALMSEYESMMKVFKDNKYDCPLHKPRTEREKLIRAICLTLEQTADEMIPDGKPLMNKRKLDELYKLMQHFLPKIPQVREEIVKAIESYEAVNSNGDMINLEQIARTAKDDDDTETLTYALEYHLLQHVMGHAIDHAEATRLWNLLATRQDMKRIMFGFGVATFDEWLSKHAGFDPHKYRDDSDAAFGAWLKYWTVKGYYKGDIGLAETKATLMFVT